MNIKDIDKNFKTDYVNENDVEWYDPNELPFDLYGIYYDKDENIYRRIPKKISKNISEGVDFLATHTAGGRLKFLTDSPYVAIKCIEPYVEPMSHITFVGAYGFSLYTNNEFSGMYTPTFSQMNRIEDGKISFDGVKYINKKEYTATLFFPLYSGVSKLFIGLKKGSFIKKALPYKYNQNILFYGSSITQGGCADKPGDDYVGRLSKSLNVNVINFGFSGNAMGEETMAKHISSLAPSIFVYDYDYNAPNVEHLLKTHYNFYRIIRETLREIPIIIMTMPTFNGKTDKLRYDVIYGTYIKAKDQGDKNVYFISGDGLLGDNYIECGSVDGCHPNDLGFYFMERAVLPLLKNILEKIK